MSTRTVGKTALMYSNSSHRLQRINNWFRTMLNLHEVIVTFDFQLAKLSKLFRYEKYIEYPFTSRCNKKFALNFGSKGR